uniref:Uncharacterized protein n=1 Tax=Prevotella sp. GTC17262 TaxID=3236797 RepID=A0AB33JQR7_9BACT
MYLLYPEHYPRVIPVNMLCRFYSNAKIVICDCPHVLEQVEYRFQAIVEVKPLAAMIDVN